MTGRREIRAAFYRGGTSNGVVFNGKDLPKDRAARDKMFLGVLGSPDAYGRQLDGMGGGISSLSKVVIVDPSSRQDADVDYTFVQIAVDEPVADYGSACGNMSSVVGPFAVEEGLVESVDGINRVRIHNTNTNQIYVSEFVVNDGLALEAGSFEIPGVSQTGAKIKLDFLEPGGSRTGKLLPSGAPINRIEMDGMGSIDISMVDAANPVAFVRASDLGLSGAENPIELDANSDLMAAMERLRRQAAVSMGMANSADQSSLSNPKIAVVAPAQAFQALDGRTYDASTHDLCVRIVSMGKFHRAITLTGAMCTAVAVRIEGSLVQQICNSDTTLRIGTPSGVLPVDAQVTNGAQGPRADSATTYRTQRRIMQGAVLLPKA